MAFSQALSGLTAASTDLNVVSNNISNSQTVGFKSSTTQFADVYADADVGLGTSVSGVVQNFESGSLTTTDNELDLAVNGEGFFTFTDGTQTVYSRNGQLTLTADGYLENAAGDQLLGVNGVIQIPTSGMTASATESLDAELNLDSSEDIIATTTTFDQTDSSTYSYSTTATVYDSLGNSHTSTLYFSKPAENTWDVHTAIDGDLLALPEVASSDLRQAIPGHDGVIFGFLLATADEDVRGHRERRDDLPAGEAAHLRVTRQASREQDLVHGPISFPVGRMLRSRPCVSGGMTQST